MSAGSRVIIVSENEEEIKPIVERLIIEANYAVSLVPKVADAVEDMKEENIDLLIVKAGTSDEDNFRMLKALRTADPDCVVVGITQDNSPESIDQIKRSGFYDHFVKGVNWEKIFGVTEKAIELHTILVTNRRLTSILKEQNSSLQKQNIMLAKRIEESTKNLARLYEDLRSTYMRTIRALAHAIDMRDHYTHSHSERVAKYSMEIAREMKLSLKEQELIRDASDLHDLGKIGISDTILLKPAGLTQEEWEKIKQHPQIGAQILEPLTFLGDVIELVRQHHEHFNGTGYPKNLKGEEILLGARILHLSDAYEAMTSPRSYRTVPFSKEQATEEIRKNSGTQFDPKIVEVFLRVVKDF